MSDKTSTPDLDTFFASYVTCALWLSVDDDGNHDLCDEISTETRSRMREECETFLKENASYIGTHLEDAGHDHWLTRNSHGTGFWDRDCYGESNRDKLTAASQAAGERYLYVGDDGLIYMD